MSARIVLITVNYHTPYSVVAFCEAVRERAPADSVALAIADNSSCFAKSEYLSFRNRIDALGAMIMDPGENLGYFGGARFVIENLAPQCANAEWIIVANSDLEFRDDDFFQRLGSMQKPSGVLGVGPDIIRVGDVARPLETNAFRENPLRLERISPRSLTLRVAIYRSRLLTYAAYTWARLRRRRARSIEQSVAPREVYMIHGSFMILHREYFDVTRGLSYPPFLFGEEIFVAEEVLRAGGRLLFDPRLRLHHIGGKTTDRLPSESRRKLELASLQWLIEEYFSSD